ncbi:MAG: hypothetical protein ACLFVJ_20220, partial [Persicimonas sp.]
MATRLMKYLLRLAAVGLFALLLSCGPDFDPYWRVNKFRLLAVKADPVILDEGEVAEIEALSHDPAGEDVEYRWEWCPFRVSVQNEYACPVDADQINEMVEEQADDSQQAPEIPEDFFELGDEATASFAYPGSREMIGGFCEAIVETIREAADDSRLAEQLPGMDCESGFEVSVRLVVTTSDDEIVARKRMILATGDESQPNQNPELETAEIKVVKDGDVDKVRDTLAWADEVSSISDDDWHEMPADQPTPIVAGIPFEVRAIVEPDSIDIWQPPAPEGSDRELLPPESESVLFRWFVSAGSVGDSRRLYVDEQNTLLEASETEFNISYDSSQSDYD